MLRREMRERREYIYRKHKEESEAKMRDRKEKLKQILAENKPIPSELKVWIYRGVGLIRTTFWEKA